MNKFEPSTFQNLEPCLSPRPSSLPGLRGQCCGIELPAGLSRRLSKLDMEPEAQSKTDSDSQAQTNQNFS